MTLAKRVYLLILFATIVMLIATGLGLYQINRVFNAANYVNVNNALSLLELDRAADALANIRVNTWQSLATNDEEKKKALHDSIGPEKVKVEQAFSKYEKEDIADDKDKNLLIDEKSKIAAYFSLIEKVMAQDAEGKHDEAMQYIFSNQETIAKMSAAVAAHREYNKKICDSGSVEAKQILNQADWFEGMIGIISLLVVALMGIIFTECS